MADFQHTPLNSGLMLRQVYLSSESNLKDSVFGLQSVFSCEDQHNSTASVHISVLSCYWPLPPVTSSIETYVLHGFADFMSLNLMYSRLIVHPYQYWIH